MAYLDEAALEREKTKQAMIAGKQPLLGENASAAMHALGVSLGVVPPGTPPSQMTQLLESLIRGPRGDGKTGIKVDEAHPLQVQPYVGRTTASLAQPYQSDDSIGATISGGFSAAKDSSLQQMLRDQQKAQAKPPAAAPAAAPTTNEAPHGPGANRARLAGRSTSDMQGVNAQFAQAARDYAKAYEEQGGHKVSFTSGYRAGDPREHGKGNAFDMQLTTKDGKPLENYRTNDPATFKAYQDFANGFHQYLEANHPDLAAKHRWGGYFSGDRSKYGSLDLMHHDLAGDRVGMAGGSWKDGLSPNQAKLFPGLTPGGGLAGKPPMAPTASATSAAPATGPHAAGVPPELTEWVAKKENFTNKAFADYGTTNIGYGTAANGRTTIDEPTARAEMNAELSRHLATIDALNPNTPPAIRNSLASLGFNTGGAALKGTGLADAVKRGDWKQAKEIFVQYDKVTDASGAKKPLHALTIRRGQEAQAFDNPNYYKDPKAGTTAAQDWGGKQDPAATPKSTAAPQAPAQAPAQPPQAETKPAPAAAPTAATTQPAPPPGAAAIAATEAEQLLPEDSPDVPATVAAEPAKPATPAPAPVVATPAPAVAAAPVKPPAAPPPAPPPPAKPAPPAPPPVNPAHAILDTKVGDLVRRGGTPEQVAQVPDFIANKTLREAMNLPMIGGRISEGVKPYFGKMGITQQQFDAAVKEGPPKPQQGAGKRAEAAPAEPAKVRYAQADTGTMTDAMPEKAVDPNAPTLDPLQQKPVQNEDGSISTVRTIGVEDQGKEVNIPTVPPEGSKVMTDAEARQRYQDTGKHLGKFDSVEQAGAAAEKLHQDEAARISEQPKGQQPAQQPQMTPQLAEALTNVYKDESRVAPDPAPAPAEALPVLPAQPTGATPGAPGGLSLAPAGLSSIPTGAIPGQGASQGGSIAMAGMLPAIENSTYSTPLLDQTAATSGAGMGLSPIAPQILQGWGWGGGGNIGTGLDWGGGGGGFDLGGGGFSMPSFGTGGW